MGDTLNTAGLTLTATYNSGKAETVSSGFTCNPTTLNTAGTQTITVSYGGKTTTFTVTVSNDAVKSIAVKTNPTKTSYYVGDTLNTAGLTLTATYNSGKTETVSSGFTCNPTTLNTVGTQTITVSYGGKTATFTVTVNNVLVTLTDIVVKTMPTKYTYMIGEPFSQSGLTLTLNYSDGSTQTITSEFTCAGFDNTVIGVKTIIVTYQGKTTTFAVIVHGKVRSVSVDDATFNYKSSAIIKPKIEADDGIKYTVKYESSDPKVASVDENGNIKALKKGNAAIMVTVADEYGNVVKDTCTITVKYTFIQWIIRILLFGWIWY